MTSSDGSRFGPGLRSTHFQFDPLYRPLNHGSYGAYPKAVRDKQREMQDATEARSDPFIRFKIPSLLKQSRLAVAGLCKVDYKDMVFIPNATTGINTVLRNLTYEAGDTILYLNTAYPACEKTILHICETTAAQCARLDVTFPLEDSEMANLFREKISALQREGKRVKVAMFDAVCTFPGVRLPWELLVAACYDQGVLSLVDGAHGIGHIDLSHLGGANPDFFASNCYKWLYTPRACAVFYVPKRNHHLIRTTFPTSHGFSPDPPRSDAQTTSDDYLGDLFYWAATVDMSPYLCVPSALEFRSQEYDGESAIRKYCFELARRGGVRMAEILGTEVMDNSTCTLSECCFTMVKLPLTFAKHQSKTDQVADRQLKVLDPEEGPMVVKDMMHKLMHEYDTWIPGKFYNGAAWMRISSQVYLELADFEWAAGVLKKLCHELQ